MEFKDKYLKYKNKYQELKAGASTQGIRVNSNKNRDFFSNRTQKKTHIDYLRSRHRNEVDKKILDHDTPEHAAKCQKLIDLFAQLIYNNRYLEEVMLKMIEEAPRYRRDDCLINYPGWKTENSLPKSIDDYLTTILKIITSAPKWKDFSNPYNGLPLLRYLINTLSTPSGFLFYGNIIVNQFFRSVLELWKEYLDSPDSRYVLTKSGWLGMYSIEDFKLNKNDTYYGFESWNDFFIRKFKDIDKMRPIGTSVVVAPADFTIINFMDNVDYVTEFLSVKGDNYSIQHILGSVDEKIKEKFAGGCLIQGFLDAEHYHRYHSPLDAKLVHAQVEDGSLYLLKNFEFLNGNKFCGQDHVIWSEAFFSNVQTRGVFIFKHDQLGYVAMIVVGMIEVSSCVLYDNLVGKKVKRGQEIGYFQYGGSSIILLFEKKTASNLKFHVRTDDFNIDREELVKIRSNFASLRNKSVPN